MYLHINVYTHKFIRSYRNSPLLGNKTNSGNFHKRGLSGPHEGAVQPPTLYSNFVLLALSLAYTLLLTFAAYYNLLPGRGALLRNIPPTWPPPSKWAAACCFSTASRVFIAVSLFSFTFLFSALFLNVAGAITVASVLLLEHSHRMFSVLACRAVHPDV